VSNASRASFAFAAAVRRAFLRPSPPTALPPCHADDIIFFCAAAIKTEYALSPRGRACFSFSEFDLLQEFARALRVRCPLSRGAFLYFIFSRAAFSLSAPAAAAFVCFRHAFFTVIDSSAQFPEGEPRPPSGNGGIAMRYGSFLHAGAAMPVSADAL